MFGRSQSLPGADALLAKPIDKQYTDTVVNFLIRVACQVRVPSVLWPGFFRTKTTVDSSVFRYSLVIKEIDKPSSVTFILSSVDFMTC